MRAERLPRRAAVLVLALALAGSLAPRSSSAQSVPVPVRLQGGGLPVRVQVLLPEFRVLLVYAQRHGLERGLPGLLGGTGLLSPDPGRAEAAALALPRRSPAGRRKATSPSAGTCWPRRWSTAGSGRAGISHSGS